MIVRDLGTTRGCSGWRILAIWFVLVSLGVAVEPPKPQAVDKSANCELILEGKQIESLLLQDERGVGKCLNSLGARVLLPQGKYSIQSISLKGGYSSPCYRLNKTADRLVLAPDKPCRPNLGAPLTQSITAKRTGRLLELGYQLLDGDGHAYDTRDRDRPPQFAIYKGEELVGSGAFEYG